jgi:hypothetical protein
MVGSLLPTSKGLGQCQIKVEKNIGKFLPEKPTKFGSESWCPHPELNWNNAFRKRGLYPFEL